MYMRHTNIYILLGLIFFILHLNEIVCAFTGTGK